MNTPSRPAAPRASRRASSRRVPAPTGRERRGVLLLIVLSMLTLFMMLGAAYLIVATRSRETARAYAKLSLRNDNIRLPHSQIFDTVMLRVLRGISTGTNVNVSLAQPAPPGVAIAPFESLLADKYGVDLPDANGNMTVALSGTAKGNPPVYEQAPVLVLPLVSLDEIPAPDKDGYSFAATDLAGRVITILGTGRDPSSHRILRANDLGNSNYELIVDNQPRNRPYEPVTGQSCRVVINGREFTGDGSVSRPNESWDGFDDSNPFLSWVAPRDLQNETDAAKVSVSSSVVKKVGFVQSGTAANILALLNSGTNGFSYGADNDNDGVNDGFFLDFGLPTVISPNGDQVTLHASVLVLDLDGRVNVNAHGSLVPIVYPHTAMSGTNSYWQVGNLPTGFTTAKLLPFPTGSGYGPPEVSLDLLFPSASSPAATYSVERLQGTTAKGYPVENPLLYLRVGANQGKLQLGRSPQGSRFYSNGGGSLTTTPQLLDVEGRYGGSPAQRFAPAPLLPAATQLATLAPQYFGPPGIQLFNDAASAITDHRSPIDPATLTGSPRTFGYDGVPPLWWNCDDGKTFNWADKTTPFTGSPSLYPRSTFNSPPDLHGRMKTFTLAAAASTGILPQLCFVKPEWSRNGNLDVETRDDPYEIRLDTRAPRNSWLRRYGAASPNGNIFNLSELENILRPYDIDSSKLPPRLEAILGSVAEEARLRITTDSWDSTVISGSAAPKLFDWARKLSDTLGGDAAKLYGATTARDEAVLDGVLNREIARGERFDLNRPLTGTKPRKYDITDPYYAQRQAYFKDLYVLLCALTPPADFNPRFCAQWVANIVEFRDADATMTPFEFDTNPADGWDVDGNVKTTNDAKPAQRDVVFGCERPEIVIAETCAWEDDTTGELYVVLHRPWNATAFGKAASGDASVAAEPCDPQLDSYDTTKKNPLNALDLGRKSGVTAANPANNANPTDRATLPVWRLRIKTPGQPDTYVRLDTRTAAGGQPEHVLADNTTPKLGVDTSICLKPQAASTIVTVVQQQQKLNVANFATLKVQGPAATFGAPDRQATIFLERLTDPTAAPDITKPEWTTQDPGTTAPSALTDSDGQLTRMAVYRVVDQQTVTVVNRAPEPVTGAVPPGKDPKTTRRNMAGTVDTFWKQVPAETTSAVPLAINAGWTIGTPKWFFWPNRPFVASPELLFVHALDSQALLTKYSDPLPTLTPDPDANNWTWGPTVLRNLKSPPIFDAVHVPTRFAGIHGTTIDPSGNLATLAGIDQMTTPVNQLSSFREPGRVNLNTVTADDVWNAVVAGPLVKPTDGSPDPVAARSQAALNSTPARNTSSLLALIGQQPAANDPQSMPKPDKTDRTDANQPLKPAINLNPSQAIYTANRLANTTTTKSHLFGVWITLREAMAPAPAAGQPVIPADPDGVRYHRAFYIIDRSIPVAHEPGRDHNVWDAVLLRRIVE
ncbi:MAG: hypothetical protein RLZZ326_4385 [Planctomycetota bacterium]